MAKRNPLDKAFNLAKRRKQPKIGLVVSKIINAQAAKRLSDGESVDDAKNDFEELTKTISQDIVEVLRKKGIE